MNLGLMHTQEDWPTKLHSRDKNKPSLRGNVIIAAQDGSLLGQVMPSCVSLRCHRRGRSWQGWEHLVQVKTAVAGKSCLLGSTKQTEK